MPAISGWRGAGRKSSIIGVCALAALAPPGILTACSVDRPTRGATHVSLNALGYPVSLGERRAAVVVRVTVPNPCFTATLDEQIRTSRGGLVRVTVRLPAPEVGCPQVVITRELETSLPVQGEIDVELRVAEFDDADPAPVYTLVRFDRSTRLAR